VVRIGTYVCAVLIAFGIGTIVGSKHIGADHTAKYCEQAQSGEWFCSEKPVKSPVKCTLPDGKPGTCWQWTNPNVR